MAENIIDKLVSDDAMKELEKLDEQLTALNGKMEEVLKKVKEAAEALSKAGMSWAELSTAIGKHVNAQQEYVNITKEVNKVTQQRKDLTESVLASEKEETKAVENQEKATKKLEQTTKQLLAAAERTAKGIDISAFIKANENGMKEYSAAMNALNQQMGIIGGLQDALTEKFRQGAISEKEYNSATSGLIQKYSEYEKALVSMHEKYEQTGAAQKKVFDPAGEAFKSLSAEVQEQTQRLVKMNAELNNTRNEQKELDKSYRDGEMSLEAYAQKKAQLNTLEAEQADAVKNLSKELQLNQQIANSAEGSYDNLSAKYSLMKIEINALCEAEGKDAEQKRKLEAQAKKLYEQMNRLQVATGKAQLQVGNYTLINRELEGALNTLNPALGRTVSGINRMTAAAMKFILTPLGAVIAAIAAGLAALSAWFKRTEEGQNALAVASAAFTRVLNEFLNVADDVGEILFLAFTSPQEAVKKLGDLIESNVTGRLRAVAAAGKAIGEIFSGDWKNGINDLGNALAQALTGQENFNESIMRSMALQKGLNDLATERRGLGVEEAKNLAEMNRLRNVANNMENTASERLAANNEYMEIANKLGDEKVRIARQEYFLRKAQTEENKKGSSLSIREKDELAKLEAEMYRAEAENQQRLLASTRTNNRIRQEGINAEKAAMRERDNAAREAMRERNRELKAIGELESFNYKKSADLQERIYKDETLAYEERRTALRYYTDYEIAVIETKEKEELMMEGLTATQKQLIHEKALYEIYRLELKYGDEIKKLKKDEIQDFLDETELAIAKRSEQNSQEMNDELLLADKIYGETVKASLGNEEERTRITRDHQMQRLEIIRRYSQKAFEAETAILRDSLNNMELSKEQREDIEKEIIKRTKQNTKELTAYELDMTEYKIEEMTTLEEDFNKIMSDKRTQAIMGMWQQALDISSMYYERQLQQIDEAEAREKESYDERLKHLQENLDAGLLSEEEAAAQKKILEDEQMQKEKQYEEQRKAIQKKQAVWQKANDLIQATTGTAVAVVGALGSKPWTPFNIALAAIVAGLGAAQIAMIAGQKVPEYKGGGKHAKDGPAIVGDGGKAEMVILPSGEIWKTPAKDTLVNLPRGTEILPDFKKAFENIAAQPVMIYRTDEGRGEPVMLYDMEQRRLIAETNKKLDAVSGELRAIRANAAYSGKKERLDFLLSRK